MGCPAPDRFQRAFDNSHAGFVVDQGNSAPCLAVLEQLAHKWIQGTGVEKVTRQHAKVSLFSVTLVDHAKVSASNHGPPRLRLDVSPSSLGFWIEYAVKFTQVNGLVP